jgi:hypothetical protein
VLGVHAWLMWAVGRRFPRAGAAKAEQSHRSDGGGSGDKRVTFNDRRCRTLGLHIADRHGLDPTVAGPPVQDGQRRLVPRLRGGHAESERLIVQVTLWRVDIAQAHPIGKSRDAHDDPVHRVYPPRPTKPT